MATQTEINARTQRFITDTNQKIARLERELGKYNELKEQFETSVKKAKQGYQGADAEVRDAASALLTSVIAAAKLSFDVMDWQITPKDDDDFATIRYRNTISRKPKQ